jgi:UDP-N-acetylglucosamine 2-epimerase
MAARALPSRPFRVVSVIGTRPEAIKMGPVVKALAARPAIRQQVLLTGQHSGLADTFGPVAADELALDLRNKSVPELRETLADAIAGYLAPSPPELVVVQGDTTSALAGALAARRCGIALAHVEAGLRSHQSEPWPEESNRVAIDALSDLLFAPTEAAAANLAAEPQVRGCVHVTGNSGIDALLHARGPAAGSSPPAERRTILVTCHRRENRAETLARICLALKRLVAEMPVQIVFPLHPNRHIRLAVEAVMGNTPHITLIEPLPYPQMVRLMEASWLILTDSGGLQEEGPALGRPVLVMRDVTERREAPANVALVGTDPSAILSAVHRLLMDEVHYARMARPVLPFGDGHAAPRIAILIEDYVVGRSRVAL